MAARKKKIIEIGSKKFLDLQKLWYNKLKDKGFEDIEYRNDFTGDMQTGHFKISKSGVLGRTANRAERYHFYSMLRNFLTHNPRWNLKGKNSFKRYIALKYVEGVSYRNILKFAKVERKNKKRKIHHVLVFQIVHEFIDEALKWNKEHPEGLEYPGNIDAVLNAVDLQSGD